MTAHSLTLQTGAPSTAPGKARKSPMLASGGRTLRCAVYEYDMGTDNYSVNGNTLATIWTDFTEVLYIGVEQADTSTAADRREFTIDYAAHTILLYTAFNTEGTASDQGVCTVRLFVVGI